MAFGFEMAVQVTAGGTTGDRTSSRLWRISNANGNRFYKLGLRSPNTVMLTTRGARTGQERVKGAPTPPHGAERDQAWNRIVADASNFGGYEAKTDREIPVVRLTPER